MRFSDVVHRTFYIRIHFSHAINIIQSSKTLVICQVMSHRITSHHVTSCHIMSRRDVTSHHMSRVTSHVTCHITSRHVTSHVTSCSVMSHHATPHHVTSLTSRHAPLEQIYLPPPLILQAHQMSLCTTAVWTQVVHHWRPSVLLTWSYWNPSMEHLHP